MKKNLYKRKTSILSIILFTLMLIPSSLVYGQIPQDTPHPNDNVPLRLDNWTNIIFFVILPVLFVLLFLWLKRKRKKSNK